MFEERILGRRWTVLQVCVPVVTGGGQAAYLAEKGLRLGVQKVGELT